MSVEVGSCSLSARKSVHHTWLCCFPALLLKIGRGYTHMKGEGILVLLLFCAPAFAQVTVSQPAASPTPDLESPFTLVASAAPCDGQSIVSMGYSFDSQTITTVIYGSSINVQASYSNLTLGQSHTLYVKAWGSSGANCTTDVTFTAVANPANTLPDNATVTTVTGIQSSPNLTWNDSGSSGTSGSTNTVTAPSLSGDAREFLTNYSNDGDELYDAAFGSDETAENFVYDTWVYVSSNTTQGGLANLEFDMNQVVNNGDTIIYGFQCDGWNGVWDYTENAGTPTAPNDTWVGSSQPCNAANWAENTWHHVQVTYSQDGSGNVTYQSVYLDGVQQAINETVPSEFALGWSPSLVTNFQTDGKTASGVIQAYLDDLTVSYW
jgi:hypothetical protein